MRSKDILEILNSKNEHLNKVSKKYLIAYLDHPILGCQKFNDIKYNLEFGLNEYRINHHQEHGYDYEHKEITELLKQFSISNAEYSQFIRAVTKVLNSYTDYNKSNEQKREMLQRQIKHFTYIIADDSPLAKIYATLMENDIHDRHTYLDNILDMMSTLGINQINNDKYIIIENLFGTYKTFLDHFVGFREKKKYLQKLKKKGIIEIHNRLHKYFKEIYDSEPNPEDGLKAIQWFYFYLIHGSAKLTTYLADSIFGSKNKNALKLVQSLFLMDHTAGHSSDNFSFSHHNFIQEVHTVEYQEKNNHNPLYREIIEKL